MYSGTSKDVTTVKKTTDKIKKVLGLEKSEYLRQLISNQECCPLLCVFMSYDIIVPHHQPTAAIPRRRCKYYTVCFSLIALKVLEIR